MQKSQFLEYILDLISPFGKITARSMFGGYGIYKDGVIFALIIKDELYFKATTKEAEQFYSNSGSEPFSYQGKKGIVRMKYWKIEPEAVEDHELLKNWVDAALNIAI